ncbi:MAG: acyltransferase [Candidatus Wallbacteria bacterium]|nr:acyltransferase [Candidatus Wallbacteria bacterium]
MKINAGFYQFQPVFGDNRKNLDCVLEKLADVHNTLIVLPELCFSGYNFLTPQEILPHAVEIPDSPIILELSDLCRRNSLYLVAGVAELQTGKLFNSAFYLGPEGFIGKFQKTHLFYREKDVFQPGSTGFQVFRRDFSLGMMICFDWFFPESARTLAMRGAQIIAHSANLVLPYCPEAMLYRSLENRVFSITCNRIGRETNAAEDYYFIGKSQVVSPRAERLICAGTDEESLQFVEIDLSLADSKKINRYNDLFSDRRPEMYAGS